MSHNIRFHICLYAVILLFYSVGLVFADTDQVAGDGFKTEEEYYDDDMLILKIIMEPNILFSGGAIAYKNGTSLFLSLQELSDMVEFHIKVDPEKGTAAGWFMKEERKFYLDLNQKIVKYDKKTSSLDPKADPQQIRRHPDDIFIDISVLEKWFPINFKYKPLQQTIQLISRSPFLLKKILPENKDEKTCSDIKNPLKPKETAQL